MSSETTGRKGARPSGLDVLPDRIAQLLDLFPTRRLASITAQVSTDQLARYVGGRSSPPFEVLARLALEKGVSLDWLCTGAGDMRLERRLCEFDDGMAVLSLAPTPEPGWFRSAPMSVRMPAPSGVRSREAMAVMAADDSLAAEGVRAGFICIGTPGYDLLEGDIVFVERNDGPVALRRFDGRDGANLRFTWFPRVAGRLEPRGEVVAPDRLARLTPIAKVRRKL